MAIKIGNQLIYETINKIKSSILVVLLLFVFQILSGKIISFAFDSCPFPDDLYDCKCSSKGLICGEIAVHQPIFLKEDYPTLNFETIIILGTRFSNLSFLENLGRWIKTDKLILIDNHELSLLKSEMISKMGVKELMVSNNRFDTSKFIEELELINNLNLMISNDKTIDKFPTFKNPEFLYLLNLSKNKIKSLGNRFLSKFTNIRELNLDENIIDEFTGETFGGIKTDYTLISLKNNQISNEALKKWKLTDCG